MCISGRNMGLLGCVIFPQHSVEGSALSTLFRTNGLSLVDSKVAAIGTSTKKRQSPVKLERWRVRRPAEGAGHSSAGSKIRNSGKILAT